MGKYVLGLDCGNTSTKAVVFDLKGNEVACSAITTERLESGDAGCMHHDGNATFKRIKGIIRESMAEAGVSGSDIVGVGVCVIQAGPAILDENNQLLAPVPLGSDTRALSICEEYAPSTDLGAKFMEKNNGMPCSVWQILPQLLWYKREKPEIYSKIARFGSWKDYLLLCMTDGYVMDRQYAAESGCVPKIGREWDREMFEIMDVEEMFDHVPTLVDCWDPVGKGINAEFAADTGLMVGTPVIAGLNDFVACRLGTGAIEETTMTMLAGTFTIDLMGMRTPSTTAGIGRDDYLTYLVSGTGAGCYEWFSNIIEAEAEEKGEDKFEVLNKLINSVEPGSTDVMFFPYLLSIFIYPGSKGCFFNVDMTTTTAELAYAVAEGIGFANRTLLSDCKAKPEIDIQKINMTGGYSRSDVWRQLMADFMAFPIHYGGGTNETGALAVAMMAAWKSGNFATLEDAIDTMARSQDVCFNPIPERKEAVDARYREWVALNDFMKPYWDKKFAGEAF